MSKNYRLFWISVLLALVGCASQPPQPEPRQLLPDAWRSSVEQQSNVNQRAPIDDAWWLQFESEELTELVTQAVTSNLNLLASLQRIEQARARTAASHSVLFPHLDVGYSSSHTSIWNESNDRIGSKGDSLGVTLSYEVDLWGQIDAAVDSARANLAVTQFNHQATALALQAEVASVYFQYLAAQDRLRFTKQSLEYSEQVLALLDVRFREGVASRLELVQQQNSILSLETQVIALRAAREQLAYALDLLVGQPVGTLTLVGESLTDIALPPIAAGQPADLLRRRPDVRQAEASLAAAHANVEVARTAFYPSFRISASASAREWIIGDPFSQAASIAASLSAPLFNAGRNRAEYQSTLAAQEETLLNYYQSVLVAASEVQSSLLREAELAQTVDIQARRLNLAEESQALATLQYREGATDFLTLLDAERTLIDAREVFMQAKLELYLEAVTLYRALGGSWADL